MFKTPVLKERDLENNVNDRVNHDDINRLKAQFIALKSLVMNEIYGLKQEILADVIKNVPEQGFYPEIIDLMKSDINFLREEICTKNIIIETL